MSPVQVNRLILPHDVNGGMIYVPREIAVCPYCNEHLNESTPLVARLMGWEQSGKRRGVRMWKVSEIELECSSEPELDEDGEEDEEAFESWVEFHSEMPYVYWLPVELRVRAWINACYRFVMEK